MPARSILLGLVLLACSCAQVAEISGGDKDTSPPVLLAAFPANGTVHFNREVIVLEFDERIQLDRVRDRLLVSPPLEEHPQVRVVGTRSVEIRLMAPLKPSTTYSFNLGECVKDLTEGNAASGLAYVLSTGEALDSLGVSGTVVNAYSGVPEKDVLVILHQASDTGDFRTTRPGYMTRCDENGNFAIGHLPPGSFEVRALRDKNANFRYDLPNEEIAFADSAVVLDPSDTLVPSIGLRAFLPASPEQLVRGVKVIPDGALQVLFARSAGDISVADIARMGGQLTWTPEWNSTRDSVLLWPSDTTLLKEGSYTIADNGTVVDTVRYRPIQRMPFHTAVQVALIEGSGGPIVRLRCARPLRTLDSSRIELKKDSVLLPYTISRDTLDRRTWLLQTDLAPGTSAKLTLYPKAITDIYGGVNDTVRAPLGRAAELATGSLRLNMTELPRPDVMYLVHLLDGQERTVARATLTNGERTIHWQRLPPGRCTLRLIEDINGNGRWDTGEWNRRLQPERTWHHTEEVNIRAAWDVVVDWALDRPSQ